jgi:hypothetical protein
MSQRSKTVFATTGRVFGMAPSFNATVKPSKRCEKRESEEGEQKPQQVQQRQ